MKTIATGLFSLGAKDILKGLIVTIITSILTSALTILNSGTMLLRISLLIVTISF